MTSVCRVLASKMNSRIKNAYAPRTWKEYKRMFLAFLTFCTFIKIDIALAQVVHITLFMEFLGRNQFTVSAIRNYLAGIVMYHKWLGLSYEKFYHCRITFMLRALDKSIYKKPIFKGVFEVEDIRNILQRCHTYPFAQIYKTLYIFAFLGFLRISNLVPTSRNTFNIMKHLCRGDVLINEKNVIIVIKWSKTLQNSQEGSYIILPRLKDQQMCPAKKFQMLEKLHPLSTDSPCFASKIFIATERTVRQHLKAILIDLQFNTDQFSFHKFRKSGAILADKLNVELNDIKRHGTWRSNAVQLYCG